MDKQDNQQSFQKGAPAIRKDNIDPAISFFLYGIIYIKWENEGKKISSMEEVQKEFDRLYSIIQNDVINMALQKWSEEKKQELNALIERGGSIEEIQQFIIINIPGFMESLNDYLMEFQRQYLGPKLSEELGLPPPFKEV